MERFFSSRPHDIGLLPSHHKQVGYLINFNQVCSASLLRWQCFWNQGSRMVDWGVCYGIEWKNKYVSTQYTSSGCGLNWKWAGLPWIHPLCYFQLLQILWCHNGSVSISSFFVHTFNWGKVNRHSFLSNLKLEIATWSHNMYPILMSLSLWTGGSSHMDMSRKNWQIKRFVWTQASLVCTRVVVSTCTVCSLDDKFRIPI